MNKTPLLEMAREQDNQATWEDDIVGGAVFLNRARILRAAAAALDVTWLWFHTGEGSPEAVNAALNAYDAACRESNNE